MYTIAYKWRLTTNKYAYITSTAYDSSNPNYRLSYISEKLPDITEDNIKNIVKRMSADEYRQCFEFMQQIIAEDNDGKYIKLKNWGYYYHFENDENGDNKILFVDAIASASVSKDNDAHVEVANNDGVLTFHFEIPRGEKGSDGIDGENGLNGNPMNDGKFSESIYKLTKNNDVPTPTLPPDWEVKGSDYQKNDYLPNGWSDTPCGISTTHKYEWVSTRKYNTVSGLWGRFSTGALMSKWGEDGRDGDGTEYIYKRTKTGEKPNITLPDNWESEDSEYQTNDEFAKVSFLTDQGWYDAPLGVSDEYHFEWVSFRKHKDGKWGAFSEPALWGTMGKDGNDIEYIFYLNNDNEPPVFDDGTNDPDNENFQVNEYKPKTDNKIWLDNYQDPTYDNRFLWMSSRKKINDVWGAFNTGVTLFNTYRLGGKAYVDLYTRSNTRLTSTSLPSYGNGVIYYNFNTDSFYSGGTGYNNIITTIPGNNNVIWSTDIPEDNTPKILFKTSALVEIKDNFDEYIPITSGMWYGPYIVSTNGENAIVQTPLVVFDDDSLSLPVREETNKPHERYKYSFNANLYYGDIKLSIVDSVVSGSSSENIINIEKSIDIDGKKLNIQFEINNSNEFTSIEYIYITLKGKYEGKDIVAEGQFKIIPFYSKDAVLYKILLNQDAIFIPSNPNKDGTIWSTVLTAQVVDNNGNEITISSDSENGLFYKNKDNVFINMPEGGLTLIASANTENNEQIAITNLPNPLNIIYKVNGTTREIEYVNFVNMPLNGVDGASSRLVFAYCSLEEGQIPTTPTGGTVDFTNNVITEYPKSTLINDETVEVEWSSGTSNSDGITWLSQCEYFNYGVQDLTWTPPIRISGAKGDKGDNPYHVELSNDMDQIYVTDDMIIYPQTVMTTISLFNGDEKALLDGGYISISNCDIFENTGITNVITTGNTTDVIVSLTTRTGVIITGNTIDVNITISGEPYGKSYNFNKTFKLNVSHGTKDYDLDVFPTFIKKNKDKQYSESAITVNITERDITMHSKVVTTLTSFTEGLSITYFYNNDSDRQNNLETIGNKIPVANVEGYNDEINKITINLYKQEKPIDQVFIECVSDGIDGTDGISPYYIELSNDYDQILTTNNKIVTNQAIETTLSIYCGNEIITANSENIECRYENKDLFTVSTGNSEDNKYFTYIISAVTNAELEQNKTYDFEFFVNSDATNLNYDISKKFKVIAINGTIDYDLDVTPTLLKKTVNGGYSNTGITIAVKETDISRTDRQINILNELPDQLSVECYINENKIDRDYSNGIIISSQDFPDNGNIYVKLLNGELTIDEATVEFVSDGKPGEPGEDGTNIEFVYKLYKDENAYKNDINNFTKYSASTKNEIINANNGWTDSPCGITKDYQIEACSQHTKEAGATGFTAWCPPFIWSKWGEDGIDGDGVEYIFQITDRNTTRPSNPGGEIESILSGYTGSTLSALTKIVNTFDFFPGEEWFVTNEEYVTKLCEDTNVTYEGVKSLFNLKWSDNPSDVGPYKPLEWVSIRRKKVNLDGRFEYTYSEPTIWAEWKRDTYDSFTEFMFTIYDSRVDLSQCTVTGCTWKDVKDGTVYTGVTTLSGDTKLEIKWEDSVPNHNMYTQSVWMVKGFASGEIEYTGDANDSGITYSEIEWTSPTKLIDNQHMQVEYGVDVRDKNGVLVTPKPINLQEIVKTLEYNYEPTDLENGFREADKSVNYGTEEEPINYNFEWTDNPTGITPTWMITSTFYNGVWSDWVVSKIKGEKGEKGETGQSIQIKGSFETLTDLQRAYEYFKNPTGEDVPSKYFNDDKLEIGDSYIVNESIVDGEKVFGYLYVFVKDDENFNAAWESVGQIKGESSFIYIAYASSVTINDSNIKIYHLTEGGIINDKKYYGTTPGKYIGIHVATQQYEGHPYPPKLYSGSTVEDNNINGSEKLFMWSKWEGEDGFGQEQIFILSGETAPKVPVYGEYSSVTSITEWNSNDFVPKGWSDIPLTTSDSDNERCCWMATRRFPFNGEGANEFKGVSGNTGGTAILFSYYASDGNDGESPIHVELSNVMQQIYTIDDVVNITQTASTIITVYSGGTPINNFKVDNNDAENGKYEYTKVYNSGTIFIENEEKIEIKVNVNGVDITRLFKVIKLNGTKNYDLNVTPTFIKKDKNDILSHSSITISVNESEISSTNREIKQTSGVPSGYELTISKDGGNYSGLTYDGISTEIAITDVNNYCTIKLTKETKIIDSVTVEILKDGKKGDTGQRGKLLYPAGRWNSGTTYDGTDPEKTPFVTYKVSDEDKYFVLTAATIISGTSYEPNKSGWTEMTQYEALYTKLLVAENGLIGGTVYNGNYIFSQNGWEKTIDVTSGVNSTNFDKFTNTSVTEFFEENIDDWLSDETKVGFIPTYLMDCSLGRAFFGNGKTIIDERGGIITNRILNKIDCYEPKNKLNATTYAQPTTGSQNNGGNTHTSIGMPGISVEDYINRPIYLRPNASFIGNSINVVHQEETTPVHSVVNPYYGGGDEGGSEAETCDPLLTSITESDITIFDLNSIIHINEELGTTSGNTMVIAFNFSTVSNTVLRKWYEGKIIFINDGDRNEHFTIISYNDPFFKPLYCQIPSGGTKEINFYFKFNELEGEGENSLYTGLLRFVSPISYATGLAINGLIKYQ